MQEFFTKLFTALEDATEGYSMVDDLYQGEMIDYLSCQSCEYQRRKCEVFRELELEISSPTVVQSLNTCVVCGHGRQAARLRLTTHARNPLSQVSRPGAVVWR